METVQVAKPESLLNMFVIRYRKINLYNEPKLTPGNETVTFDTEFGVTFGLFTCFDILYQNPSRDILDDPRVTDIIYSAGWFSTLPFYSGKSKILHYLDIFLLQFISALSVQHGYASANGVNLLAANYDSPKDGNGGSGIYLANGQISEVYVGGTTSSKLLVQRVPKIQRRESKTSCVHIVSSISRFFISVKKFHNSSNYDL